MSQGTIIGLALIALMVGGLVALAVHFRESLLRGYEKTVIFVKEVRVEMQKVVWPSRQDVYGATFVVMVSVVALTIAIGLEDRILSVILDKILLLTAG